MDMDLLYFMEDRLIWKNSTTITIGFMLGFTTHLKV